MKCDERLIELLTSLFNGRYDKAGDPYINHLLFVGRLSYRYARAIHCEHCELAYVIGLCHDRYEDLDQHAIDQVNELITQLYPDQYQQIVHCIQLLTHDRSVQYRDYLAIVKTSKLATIVKAADTYHNSMISRFDRRLYTDE